jgi:hypothetical protein
MKIESMVRREGTTPVFHDGVLYKFEPITEYDTEGNIIPGPTTGQCEVQNDDHIQYFLAAGHGTQFREYVPRPLIRATKVEKNEMEGFSFERHLDGTSGAGYIVVDTKRNRFGGANGWGDRKDRIAFTSQLDAFSWLKEEVAVLSAAPEASAPVVVGSEVVEKKFACTHPECEASFVTSLELARHYKIHPKG